MTAGGDNRDAFEDLIDGYALPENDGLDRSAKLLQTLHKTRHQLESRMTFPLDRLHHDGVEPVAQNEDRMLCETFKQLRRA